MRSIWAGILLAGVLQAQQSVYVDSAVCATCHREIAERYAKTGMARSMSRPASGADGTSTVHHELSGRDYAVDIRGGKLYERRSETGYQNRETNVLEMVADWAVGSGNHAITYLHRTDEGKLVELPVSWYSEKGGYWAMSPGYDRKDSQDFRRPIPYDCLFCHNAYPAGMQAAALDPDAPVFPAKLPEGIDCQRCHGPGSAHVASAGRGAIVNPAKLPRDRQMDVCQQCHLETTSARLPNGIRRYDRKPFSFRAGESLADYFLYFDHAPGTGHDDDLEVAHQAYRLRKSACFRNSQMTCITCHDPHEATQTAESYQKVCRNCHASAHRELKAVPDSGNCLDCHMPKRRTQDAVHVVMTDHYIQRVKPSRDLLADLSEPEEAAKYAYRGEVVPYGAANELYTAVAQVEHQSNLAAGIPALEAALAKFRPTLPDFYFELGRAHSQAGDLPGAVRWHEEALRKQAGFRPALRELAAAFTSSEQWTRAIAQGERAAALTPVDTTVLTNLGNAYLHAGNAAQAIRALTRALGVNPDLPEASNLLGLARLQSGDRTGAEKAFREALRIEPGYAEAHNNLGNVLAGGKDYRQAVWHFEKAIALKPDYAEAHHNFAIALGAIGEVNRAAAELREAIRIDPKRAQAHADLADMLSAGRDAPGAIAEYREAVRLKPDLAEAQLMLGILLVRTGNAPEGRQHLQKAMASSDPDVRKAAADALK